MVARAGAEAGIAGLAFFSGIPGTIGGALRMNGGAYGGETKDVLSRRAASTGRATSAPSATPRWASPTAIAACRTTSSSRSAVPGPRRRAGRDRRRDGRDQEQARGDASRATAPAARRSRTRPATSAWKLIDAAGCRGLTIGDAQVSEMHCNFLINLGGATAADIETLGETVRARVKAQSGHRTGMGN